MAILETIFCKIFEVISTILETLGGEKITTCINFNDNTRTLDENLQVLVNKASDIETKVKNVEELGKKKRTTEVENWLEKVAKFKKDFDEIPEAGFCKPLMHGSHVKKLIEGVAELTMQCQTFHELVIDGSETSGMRLFTTRLHGEILMGELDKMLAWLEAKSEQVPCIGIYGMGGVGKTTFAKHICKYLQDKPDNVHVYWITISQGVDIKKLQNCLVKELGLDLPQDDDADKKAAIVNRALIARKNVVLVFDDVWEYFDLEKIGIPLRVDRCKVIITSRLLNMCNQMGCKQYTIKVKPLPEEEAWKLFLKKLDCGYELSPNVEEVAKSMAKKCAGLPLAIITLARSMIGVYDIHEWRDALEELKQSIMGRDDMKSEVLPILQYSYNRLKDLKLQQCFLYCSLYPEDENIPRDELISLFIYEGLMQRESRAAEFDQGHTVLNKLVNVSLLESVGEEYVKMHDLLREMAVDMTRNNPRFIVKARFLLDELPDEQEWTEDLNKVSLMHNNISKISEGLSPRCPQLSMLILSSNPLMFIPESFFARMRGLRVLNLGYTQIETLPNSISELENLTALLLGGCRHLCYVPSLRKLKALIELDICGTGIVELPEGMECLVKLKCLNLLGTNLTPRRFLTRLSRLSRLQRLLLPRHIKVQSEELEGLKLLEEFEGWSDDIFCSKWSSKSPPLSFYKIVAGDANDTLEMYFKGYERWIKLEKCTFKRGGGDVLWLPQNIQCLVFHKCKGLSSCLLEDVPSLYHSKDLQKCLIDECDGIESILRISSSSNDVGALQNLEHLVLCKLPNFIGLIIWEPRALALPSCDTFSSLKMLKIAMCHKIKKLFSQKLLVNNLRNLVEIDVSHCDLMEKIIANDEEDEGVGSTSNSSNIAFPNLRSIRLTLLPELDSICKGEIISYDFIEEISIVGCAKLKRLPFFHPTVDGKPPPSSASSSSSSSSSNNKYTNIITFPKLTSIRLCKLPKLASIYKGTIIRCDSIQSIYISDCLKLKRLPFFNPSIDEKPNIPSVSSHSPSSSYNNCSATSTFRALQDLYLSGLPQLNSICDGIMICDSLKEISISDCEKLKTLPFLHPSVSSPSSSSSYNDNCSATSTFPELQYLYLCNLLGLGSICNGIMICDSIKHISITGCRQLSRLPLFLPLIDGQPSPPPSLEKIDIEETEKEWWASLEWDHPNSNNVLRPFLKVLSRDD